MDDTQRLIVAFEARMTAYERQLARAKGRTRTEFQAMEKQAKTSADRMTSIMAGAFKTIAAPLLGVGIVAQMREVAKNVATIGDEARRAGVSMSAFQEWKYVAEQNRIGIDQMIDGFKELNLRADEFAVTGKGPAAEAFARLGYGADELKAKLANPNALMLEIIGRLGRLDKAAQIRVADEIFGGSAGERFVELIEQGEAGIRSTIDEAHRLGLIMDDELVRNAAELDRQFNAVANTVGTALKRAIVSAAASLSDFIARFQSFEARRDASLQAETRSLGME